MLGLFISFQFPRANPAQPLYKLKRKQCIKLDSKVEMATTFSSTSFAEGRFRRAYKGIFTKPPSKEGMQCVVKEKKASYTWAATDWDIAVEVYKKAQSLADNFNKELPCTKKVMYVNAEVQKVTKSLHGTPKLNEYVLVEDYIPGKFTKWCNNYGYISSDSRLMPAFMHWSWVSSKGCIMIADLQGIKEEAKYILTDPVVMSNTTGGKYGSTDTGVEGIAMFFLKHTCNDLCRKFPRPMIGDVLTSEEAKLQIGTLSTSTAYSHELKIPDHYKKRMITIFPTIASRT